MDMPGAMFQYHPRQVSEFLSWLVLPGCGQGGEHVKGINDAGLWFGIVAPQHAVQQ